MAEIAKASKHEACTLPSRAEAFFNDIQTNVSDIEKRLDSSFPFEGETAMESRESG